METTNATRVGLLATLIIVIALLGIVFLKGGFSLVRHTKLVVLYDDVNGLNLRHL